MDSRTKKLSLPKKCALAVVITLIALSMEIIPVRAQQSAAKQEAAPAGDIVKGKEAYKKHSCFSCHGFSGNGGTGPRIAQTPIPFPAFRKYVRRPTKSMPPFGTLVSDAELADIYAFLKSIPPSPSLKDIPLLKE